MKKFTLLLTGILFSVLTFAQTLNLDTPVTLSNGAFGETVEDAGNGYNIISRDASQIFATPATTSGSTYSLGTATGFFPNSADYSIYYRTVGGNPDFYKTGTSGTVPNRNITIEGANTAGSTTFNLTPNTAQDDYGVRTIGTTDGILTAALRETNSDLYQIVLIKTNPTGTIEWETSIPTDQTGYDDTFTGQDANGNFTNEITPEPYVKQIKEVADGFIVVNMSRRYFPPGTSSIFATFIKLDFAGNILWSTTTTIPTRSSTVGNAPSSEGNIRYFVGDVTGFENGNTYIPYAGGSDLRPYAQVRILDNTGTSIANYTTTYIVLDDGSFQVKKFNNRIYWLRRTETFFENTAPIFTNDFSIVDITDGFNLVDPAVAILPPTPGEFYIPNDMELTPEGNFLVTGSKYPSSGVNGNNPDPNEAEPFAVILEANTTSNGADLALSVEADNDAVGIYDYVELTYTVTNEGNTDVTGIEAAIRRTTASVLAGDFPSDASQGNLNNGFSENATWNIGNLNAGQSATLSVTYFTLSASTSFCGEITAMSDSDTDSSPNNATCESPQEDDETYIEIGQQAGIIRGTVFLDQNRDGGEDCQLDGCIFIPNIEIGLYIQGTNTLVATAVSQANGAYLFPNVSPGQYTLEYEYQDNYVTTPYFGGNAFQFNNNFLAINNESPYIGVSVGNGGEQVFNLGLVDGTDCTLDELFVETICNNNGTPNNPNDDTFEVNFRADGEGRGTYTLNGGTGSLVNNLITYTDGFELIGPFAVNQLPVTLTVNNLGNLPSTPCSLSETITSVDCGSTGGNQPDLTITTTGTIPASMQPGQNYPSAANITNSGTAAASGTQFNNIIYLSTDANLDASDISLSVVGLNFLEAGANNAFLNIFIPANAALGEYFILYVVDQSNTIEESNENNNILARPVTIGPIGTGDVDLELTASADVPNIWQNGEAVFTLTNTGSQTATNIEVLFAKNSSLNITGVPTTSQGTSAVHWTAAPEWSVGSLAAGQSATITFDIFALSDAPTLYGQVVFQSEVDTDSTPDNGNGSTAVEDDEAVYPGGGSTGGDGLQVNCNTTTSPPSPIAVNPDINLYEAEVHWDIPTATTDCPGGIVNIEQINGPTQQGFFLPVGNGYTVVYEITDECGNSETCIISFNVNGFAGELVCPDDITVTATSPAGAIVTFADAVPFTGCIASPTGPFDGEPMSGDLFPIGTTEIRFAEFFSGNPSFCQNLENCYMNITVLPEDGSGGDGVDLELTASSDAPAIWQSGTAVFTISNNGNETATGIELEFDKNSSLNITGTPTVSQGTSQVHWTDTPRWNVGTLAAGQSATITYSVFAISESINFYGQVSAQNENDADSTPNNGNGNSPNEDDEASYPGGGSTGGDQADLTLSNLNSSGPVAPGDIADYTVLVSNIGTATASGSYVIGAYLSTDSQLSNNDVQVGVINTGNTPVGTEPLTTGAITVPANQTPGNYFLILETDTNGDIAESNENNNVISTPIFISVVDSGCLLNIEIGTISCSTAGTPNNPSDDTYSFTFTVFGQNASNTANMSANVNVPSSVNLGQTYTVTGTSASIAQVNLTATDPNDATCQSGASVNPPGTCGQGTGGGGCGLSAELVSVSCLQNMNEDRYNFVIRVDVAEGSDTENWSLAFPNGTNYSGTSAFYPQGSAAVADGVQTFEVVDQDNSACNVQVTVTPPADCENIAGCQLGIQATNIACTGDNFSFRLYVNSGNFSDSGTDWTGVFPLADGSGGTFEIVRPINGSVFTNDNYINYSTADVEQYLGGEINYTVYHNSNPSCTIDGTLYLTSTGCDPSLAAEGDIDLSLDIQVPQNVVPYQNFETDYIVYNDGVVTATDVEVDVRLFNSFNSNVFVLQGGNEATASQGEFDGEFGSTWTVGSIAPGGSATLTLNMFSLEIGSSEIYGQVSQHNERDVDSNPDNYILDNFILIEREDDEKLATVAVSSNLQGGNTSSFTQHLNGLSANLYPVPTRGNLTVDVFMENAVETQLSIRDTNGKELMLQNLAAQEGIQTVEFSTRNWSNGVYFLQLFNGEEMKTYRFVKL